MKRLLRYLLPFVLVRAALADPGTVTVTNFTMNPGGRLEFELNSATATPGNGADFLNVLQVLTIAAGTTPNSVFTIAVISLSPANATGPLADFNPTRAYHYTLATVGVSLAGFDPARFAIDTTQFQNGLGGGSFSLRLSTDGRSLILDFRPALAPPFRITQLTLDTASMPGAVRAFLTWNAVVGLTYRIQKRSDLVSGAWTDESPNYEATTTAPSVPSFYTSPAPTKQFYRVMEVPVP